MRLVPVIAATGVAGSPARVSGMMTSGCPVSRRCLTWLSGRARPDRGCLHAGQGG